MEIIQLEVAVTQVFGFNPELPATLYINNIEPFDEPQEGSTEENPITLPMLKVSTQLVQKIEGGQLVENRIRTLPAALLSLFTGYDPVAGKPILNLPGLNTVLGSYNVTLNNT